MLLPFVPVHPFAGLFAPHRPFSETLGQSGGACRAQRCLKKKEKKRKGRAEGWTLFIAFSSCLVLAHCFLSCSSPSPCRLTSIPPFPLLSSPSPSPSPPLFSKPSSSLSGCMNTAEFHLNPRTWELWAKARGAADTPLPHPEQLLNLRNRIISAKGRSHCSTVRNAVNKPQKKNKKKSGRRERRAGDGRQKTVCQLDADISNCSDRFGDEFLCRCIDPDPPSAQPDVLNLLFKACSKGCNHIRLTAYIKNKRSKRRCFLQYLKRK